MAATCLICGDHIRRHGVLPFEALGCVALRPDADDEDSAPNPARDEIAETSGAPAGPVLVVEDNDDVRGAVMALIETDGFATVGATNGQEALERLRCGGELPCLIVLDLMMPVMDGATFRRLQLEDATLAQLPVVVVTAYGRAFSSELLGGVELIGKPVDVDHLLDVVRARCLRK
jgi:CheY-like chemotaxis protein